MSPVESIAVVTRRLQRLGISHAFLGGSVVSLLVDHPELHIVRPTKDVDALVKVITQAEYARLEERLRANGFANDTSEGAPLCRYIVEGCTADVMPLSEAALGLNSRWFPEALAAARLQPVGEGVTAPVISPAYFLATKLEAFKDRGRGDFLASHDLEDLLAVVDGCGAIVGEILQSPADVRDYLATEFSNLLKHAAFREAISGHLPQGPGDQDRLPLVMERLEKLAKS